MCDDEEIRYVCEKSTLLIAYSKLEKTQKFMREEKKGRVVAMG